MNNVPAHYSPAIQAGNLVFTSGQLPLIDPVLKKVATGIEAQTRLTLQKVEDAIATFGLSRNHIIKTTAYISNMDDWGIVNAIYAEFFGEHKPTRSIVPVSELHYGCLIEIDAIASTKPN